MAILGPIFFRMDFSSIALRIALEPWALLEHPEGRAAGDGDDVQYEVVIMGTVDERLLQQAAGKPPPAVCDGGSEGRQYWRI